MKDTLLLTHTFKLNKLSNGGEELTFLTTFRTPGFGEVYATNQIILNSYGNSAILNVSDITPKILRELADGLEHAEFDARTNAKNLFSFEQAKTKEILSKLTDEEKKLVGLR